MQSHRPFPSLEFICILNPNEHQLTLEKFLIKQQYNLITCLSWLSPKESFFLSEIFTYTEKIKTNHSLIQEIILFKNPSVWPAVINDWAFLVRFLPSGCLSVLYSKNQNALAIHRSSHKRCSVKKVLLKIS